jgi:pyruvate formate lyase activating enzyme
MRARYWHVTEGSAVQCELCPHECTIGPGSTGICGVRENQGGTLVTLNYCCVSSSGVDPIEKKPLYHFFPGSAIVSFGTFGCSFSCRCCQNFRIAKEFPRHALSRHRVTPEEMIDTFERQASGSELKKCCGVAYTYSEPVVWAETVLDVAPRIRALGYKNVLVTNGYIRPAALADLLEHVDALNIDLKAFDDEFYRTYCGGTLAPVLDAIAQAAERAHVELTTLIIPTLNDSDEKIVQLRDWVADTLGEDTPLHVSRYFPVYKLSVPPTSVETLQRVRELLRERLRYVYIGNLGDEQDTDCAACGARVITRQGYTTEACGLTASGQCVQCGAPVATMA